MTNDSQISLAFRIARFLVLATAFYALLPRGFYNQPGAGLDSSWQIALHMNKILGLKYGRDFIFTYGPLGFLSTRMPIGEVKLDLLLGDLFVYANLLLVLVLTSRQIRSWYALALFALFFYVQATAYYFMELAIVLLAFVILYYTLYLQSRRVVYFLIGLVNALILFYVKLNTALLSLFLTAFVLTLLTIDRKSRRAAVIFAVISLGAFFGSSYVLPVDLSKYLLAAVHIANGYNDAMYAHYRKFDAIRQIAIAYACLLGLLIAFNIRSTIKSSSQFFCASCASLFTYIIFKQAFVRGDEHVYTFFDYAAVTPAFLYFGMRGAMQKTASLAIACAICMWGYVFWDRVGFWSISGKWAGLEKYAADLNTKEADLRREIPARAALPQALLSEVGQASVDVIPTDISYLYYNNLKYRPRPVIQSYSAYTGYLDKLGYDKYLSPEAPNYIIFSKECIDSRYCFFDEAQTKLAMMRRYEVAQSYSELLLLKQRATVHASQEIELVQGEVRLGERVALPESEGLQYIYLDIDYSLKGKIQRVLYQPPKLEVKLFLDDGSVKKFRAIVPIVRSGVPINPFVQSQEEFVFLFKGELGKLRRIKAVQFFSHELSGFERTLKYRITSVKIEAQ